MTVRTVTVRIARDGSITADTHGFSGVECLAHVERLERMLEAEATDSAFTAEASVDVEQAQRAALRQDAT